MDSRLKSPTSTLETVATDAQSIDEGFDWRANSIRESTVKLRSICREHQEAKIRSDFGWATNSLEMDMVIRSMFDDVSYQNSTKPQSSAIQGLDLSASQH